ncbi:MAG: glutathione S-transferase family protein [Acidobacteriota bacterium]
MKLHETKTTPNSRRVRVFLAEKGIEVETVEVDITSMENRSDGFLAKNPMGKVPVLELDDGTFVSESAAICRYFEELQPSPPLFGTSAQERAEVEMWHRRMELDLAVPIMHVFQNTHPFFAERIEQLGDYAERCRKTAAESMLWLDGVLADRPFIAGDEYTVADIVALIGIDFGRVSGIKIDDPLTHLKRWHDEVSARPSAKA